MASVFIDYSRKDVEFARKLTEAFTGQGLDYWIDWEDIPPTVDWWKEIERAIEDANIYLYLISPNSIASDVSQRSLEVALKNNKRIIPVVVREVEIEKVHPAISQLNWIFIRDGVDDFDNAVENIVQAIKIDWLNY